MYIENDKKHLNVYKMTNSTCYEVIKGGKFMRKKILSVLLCATMATAMMTGCGKSSDDKSADSGKASSDASSKSSGPVKLTVWGAEGDQDFLKGVVENFKKAYSDQKFDIEIGVESESTAKDTVLTDIEAAADVYSFASDQLADLVRAGALANVDSDELSSVYSKANKTIDDIKSANVDDSIEASSIDGKMYAFPTSGANTYFLYYDKSVISEKDAAKWDTILADAKKAGKKVGMTLNSGWYLASYFYGAGFTTGLNEDGTTTMDWNGTSADGIKGADVVKAMLDITSNSAFKPVADGKMSDAIPTGDYCAVISGVWDSQNAQKVWGKNYAAIKLPTYTFNGKQVQMKPAYGYKMEGVNAYSKNLGWATLLAEYISNEESQTAHFDQVETPPTNKVSLESDALKSNIAVLAATSEGDIGVIQSVGGKYWDPTKTFGEMIAKHKLSATDDKAIQKALDNLVSGVTASLD